MSEKISKKEIVARINAACKKLGLDEESLPMTWGDKPRIQIPVIPTPSARLNAAIGVGGIPMGRITEIFGGESSGKTTLSLQVLAKAQEMGYPCAFIDMEHALDASYAQALGINMHDLFVSQPKTGDDAMKLAKAFVESGVKVIVVDSVAALVSVAEYEKEITDNNIGLQARMLSQGLRQLAPLAGAAGTALIFINQMREKVGVMYGNPEVTPGGKAMKYYTSIRLDLRATGPVDDKLGSRTTRIKVVKNKLAPPFKSCEVDIIFGKGFDRVKDTVAYAKELEIITGRGWLTIPILLENQKEENLKFQGLDAVVTYVENNPEYLVSLMKKCEEKAKTANSILDIAEDLTKGENNE